MMNLVRRGSRNSTGLALMARKIAAMNGFAFLAIGIGAVLGAWLRYALGLWLNPLFTLVPLGTLAANLVGGYLVGAAVAVFHINVELPAEVKLFFITGFLGALTTFSTFSAEVVALIRTAQYAWAFAASALHLFGSLAMTGLGIYTILQLGK
jgi:CrcB protein